MKGVKELEAELTEAKRQEAIIRHQQGLEAARAVNHNIDWINYFFKERAVLNEIITADQWNRLQGGNYDETVCFRISAKDSGYQIILRVGQQKGGWRPYHSEMVVEDIPTRQKILVQPGSVFDNSEDDMPVQYKALCGPEMQTPTQFTQWLCALENYISAYLRITKMFRLETFSCLFHLALINEF